MVDLMPCPFCGKRQAIHKELGGWLLNTTSHNRKCIMRKLLSFGMSGGLMFNTKAEAIAAWNTRAERTCHAVDVYGYTYRFECSACGYVAIVHNCGIRLDELPNYCPNCGAKVIGG